MADKSMEGLNTFTSQEVEKVQNTGKKMRIGFIGCGWIAGSHIKAFMAQPDVEIVAGCDLIPGKAKAFFEKYGVEGVKTDYKDDVDMIADKSLNLDAVTICTYNRQHAAPAIHALEAGLHVLLEKPFTVTTEEAIEVMRAEKKSGKVLSIGFQPRLDANMQMIKKIVQSGELGKIYYIQTGGGRRRGIPTPFGTTFIEDATAGLGALGDIGCYSLDMVLNAIGYPKPLTVSGYKSAFFGTCPTYSGYRDDKKAEYAAKFGVDDFAAAFIRLEGDIILDFRIAWAMNMDTPGDTIILGTKGGLRIPESGNRPYVIYHEVAGTQVETEIPKVDEGDVWYHKIRSFLDASKNGTKSPVPTSEILYNQAIIDGIARSSELGKEIELNLPDYDKI